MTGTVVALGQSERDQQLTTVLLAALQDKTEPLPIALAEQTGLELHEVRRVMASPEFLEASKLEFTRQSVLSLLHSLPNLRAIAMGKNRRDAVSAFRAIAGAQAVIKDGKGIDEAAGILATFQAKLGDLQHAQAGHRKRITVTPT